MEFFSTNAHKLTRSSTFQLQHHQPHTAFKVQQFLKHLTHEQLEDWEDVINDAATITAVAILVLGIMVVIMRKLYSCCWQYQPVPPPPQPTPRAKHPSRPSIKQESGERVKFLTQNHRQLKALAMDQ